MQSLHAVCNAPPLKKKQAQVQQNTKPATVLSVHSCKDRAALVSFTAVSTSGIYLPVCAAGKYPGCEKQL